jgi:hypothetical protein
MYRLGALNRADALTCREQDTDALQFAKSSLQMQVLLKPEQLDPRIKLELATDALVSALEPDIDLDLVNSLLQTNQTLESLKDFCKKALVTAVNKDTNCKWKLKDRLLTYLG